jgi:Flp pilus assembly protein TadG
MVASEQHTGSVMNRARTFAHAIKCKLGGLAADERGVSAVEFAMLLPLMMTLYLGSVEVSQGIGADRKVTLTARTICDLVSQVASINSADMTNALNASAAVMAPFPVSNLKVTVSSVKIDANGNATIDWSKTLNGSTYTQGSTVTTLPAALKIANTSLIWSEVQYTYKPVIGYVVTGTMTLKDKIYMRPRVSDSVQWSAT